MRDLSRSLANAGIERPEPEAYELVRCVLGLSRAEVATADVDDAGRARVSALARRRSDGVPLQYLTGLAAFRHLELRVGSGVMIPRPETEVVAERAVTRLPEGGSAVDIGTGSGAIALAIAYERPDARVFATEIDPGALRWARANREASAIAVDIIEGDLFEGVPLELRGAVDVVVSNPPYIAEDEADLLPPEVVDHEPHGALFAGGSGLDMIERVAESAREWLRPDGWIVLEIAPHRAPDVRSLLERLGYRDVTVSQDLAGRDRIAEGRL